MPYDAFTRFPRRFSSRPSLAKNIYRSMRNAMGPAFDQNKDSNVQAKLYARAMGMAHAMRTLERVKRNQIAISATDLLSNLEYIYGVIPGASATFRSRRQALHARMMVSRGSRPESIQSIMIALLGDSFEEWLFATADTLIRYPDTTAEATLAGSYVPAGSSARVLRALAPVFSGTQTILVEELTGVDGATTGLVGRKILVDPASTSRRETVTIEGVTTGEDGLVTSLTATFAGVHDSGTLLTTQYFPTWRSSANQHAFVVSQDVTDDRNKVREVNESLSRAMRGISTWSVVRPGPIAPDTGLVGVTQIGDAHHVPAARLQAIFGSDLAAYYGEDPEDWTLDTSGNDRHLTSEGADEPEFQQVGSYNTLTLTGDVILENEELGALLSGTDVPYSMLVWGYPEITASASSLHLCRLLGSSAEAGFYAINDMSGLHASAYRFDDTVSGDFLADISWNNDQRFVGLSFPSAAGTSRFIVGENSSDYTQETGALNYNPTSFTRFRIGPADQSLYRMARVAVISRAVTEVEMQEMMDVFHL